jgi:hypothetical protein
LNEQPLNTRKAVEDAAVFEEKGKTVLYLAYGSNLCNETFRGARGIKPISQINVLVPELRLTFDLPGIPYTEPCFANSARRDPGSDVANDPQRSGYHKDRWHKGMVGCVYEVTASDYAHIIATEGGGASYKDILVECYPLPQSKIVPENPQTPSFKAHTLFAPVQKTSSDRQQLGKKSHFSRPDPSYAQPSARYLKLITDGASELGLPVEYQEYLQNIRSYTITTKKQAIGKSIFLGLWVPFLLMLFGLAKMVQDENGNTPQWYATLMEWFFMAMWATYDTAYKNMFGDGERTEGQDEDRADSKSWRQSLSERRWRICRDKQEKERLLV